MRRPMLLLATAGTVACSSGDWVRTDPAAIAQSRTHQQAGLEAAETGDVVAYLDHFKRAAALRPGYPNLEYHLARAYAMLDSTQPALQQLRLLAGMGVGGDLSGDSAFAILANLPAFAQLNDSLVANEAPRVHSAVRLSVEATNLLVEGIAYDRQHQTFFLGSVHEGLVLGVGEVSVDTLTSRQDDTWGMMGMVVDASRQILWAANSAVSEVRDVPPADVGRAVLLGVDLRDGHIARRVEAPADAGMHVFGDVALAPDGTVYVSDARRPAVYRLSTDERRLEPLLVGEPLQSPQGIAVTSEGRVYLADYALGVVRVVPDSGTIVPLPFPRDAAVLGIDGLYAWRGDLIGIQNGFLPLRVIRLRLGNGGTRIDRVEVLESNHPRYPEPTLGTVVGDTLFYIANADWARFADGTPSDRGENTVVLALGLR